MQTRVEKETRSSLPPITFLSFLKLEVDVVVPHKINLRMVSWNELLAMDMHALKNEMKTETKQ